jgi:hypothetical protein
LNPSTTRERERERERERKRGGMKRQDTSWRKIIAKELPKSRKVTPPNAGRVWSNRNFHSLP